MKREKKSSIEKARTKKLHHKQKVDIEFVYSIIEARGYTRHESVEPFIDIFLKRILKLYAAR
jgi:hypothetical protein